jgi:hypothetical protein
MIHALYIFMAMAVGFAAGVYWSQRPAPAQEQEKDGHETLGI